MIDHVAILPAYVAAGTAVLVLLADLLVPGRRVVPLGTAAVGAAATAVTSAWLGASLHGGERSTFCQVGCSYVVNSRAAALMALFAALALGVLALSDGIDLPAGEYAFLLACSLTGGVVLAGAADLITLLVALETVTLPLYVLVGLRRRSVESAEAAVTFLVVSVVSTAVSLLGAALLYASTGAVHFARLKAGLAGIAAPELRPLAVAGMVLLLAGLGFKVAAVPLHGWAPATYDGAPLPVAAYLSTVSKLSGVVAIGYVVTQALPSGRREVTVALVVLALLTMTIGNLVALRQRRMVRLLAWSSIGQAGYILIALAVPDGAQAAFAYAAFFVLLELGAFGAVIALRGAAGAGGELVDYAGVGRRAPWRSAALALALAGLAGLPPGVAGLFAKVVVVRALVGHNWAWLAIAVAINAVIGLAYYVRAGALLFAAGSAVAPRPRLGVIAALVVITVAGLAVGFAPQLVLHAAVWR
jgi:NADH-quinone oxidoreductase subunit N